MSALVVRIIGGVCGGAIGTFISGQIYDYIYNKPVKKVEQPNPPQHFESKFQHVKSFEEILNIELREPENNNPLRNEKDAYIIEIINNNNENDNKDEKLFINDAIHDNTYIDYYSLYFGHEKEN
jgi:hypothetical protein